MEDRGGLKRKFGQGGMGKRQGVEAGGSAPVRSLRDMKAAKETHEIRTPRQELLERVFEEKLHEKDKSVKGALEELIAEIKKERSKHANQMPLDVEDIQLIFRMKKVEIPMDLEGEGFDGSFEKLKKAVEAYDAKKSVGGSGEVETSKR